MHTLFVHYLWWDKIQLFIQRELLYSICKRKECKRETSLSCGDKQLNGKDHFWWFECRCVWEDAYGSYQFLRTGILHSVPPKPPRHAIVIYLPAWGGWVVKFDQTGKKVFCSLLKSVFGFLHFISYLTDFVCRCFIHGLSVWDAQSPTAFPGLQASNFHERKTWSFF